MAPLHSTFGGLLKCDNSPMCKKCLCLLIYVLAYLNLKSNIYHVFILDYSIAIGVTGLNK